MSYAGRKIITLYPTIPSPSNPSLGRASIFTFQFVISRLTFLIAAYVEPPSNISLTVTKL